MKIVFIGSRDLRLLGGIENYMYNLTRELTRLGHECLVYCESDRNASYVEEGVRVVCMKGPRSPYLCKPWVGLKATLKTLLRERDVTLIHYNAWPPSLWSWMGTLAGIPTVMMGHGLEWRRTKYSPFQRRVLRLMERITAHTNRHLLMCSREQADYFWQTYHRHAVTLPTAVNLPPEVAPESDILQRLGLEGRRYVLYMGRFVQDKNPDFLIRGFRAAAPAGYALVMAGDNPADPAYVKRLRELAAGDDSILFPGAVYGADKDALMRGASLFCLPSTIEGLSIVLLEAISYKLPLLLSGIAANREVVDAADALWVEPENDGQIADALSLFAADPEQLSEGCGRNYERIRREYLWEGLARDYADYVRTIAKEE